MDDKALEQALYIAGIIRKQRQQPLSEEESDQLALWLEASEENRQLHAGMTDTRQLTDRWRNMEQYNDERLIENVISQLVPAPAPKKQIITLRRWLAAASVLLLLATGTYFLVPRSPKIPAIQAHTILPGTNKAMLTLSDGSVVTLDSAGNQVIQQAGTTVKQTGGQLSYDPSNTNSSPLVYNTLTTPRGGQFQIRLPDGTHVWLNATSSIRFPTAFKGKDRQVEISGEVYLEVAQDASRPFRVSVQNKATIDVLGTHFNVNAYPDETTINTTLLEGAVRVKAADGDDVVLKPGQQARIVTAQKIAVRPVDTDQVIAWKNGVFDFQDADLQSVMRQLSRWYNIEVVYEKGIPDIVFDGKMGRNLQLADVLMILARSKVHFRIENNNRLIVMP